MDFDQDTFGELYEGPGYGRLSGTDKAKVKRVMEEGKDYVRSLYMTKEEEQDANDGFETVKSGSAISKAKKHVAGSDVKTGAVLVGYNPEKKTYGFHYYLSGPDKSGAIAEMRAFLKINPRKPSFCAEEHIIANNCSIRFYASTAFRTGDSGTTPIIACGYAGTPATGCKCLLRELGIEEIDWSK